MRRIVLWFAVLTLVLMAVPLAAGVKMDKAHLPKKPFKIYDGHLSADQKRCLQYALKQWAFYDQAPLEGQGNRGSTGAAITEAGGQHDLGDVAGDDPHARSQRSLGALERGAMQKAYGDASPFREGGDPTTAAGAGWFTGNEGEADLSIEPTDEVPNQPNATFGLCEFGTVEVPESGTNKTHLVKGRLASTAAAIYLRNKPTPTTEWCYPSDTDGDGYITNRDTPCPPHTTDYYMIIKHELAHYFSFSHEGNQFEHVENPPPVYEMPQSLCSRAMTPANEQGICESQGSEFASHAGRAIFSSNRPGGSGGFDLWSVVWNDSLASWGDAVNLGPSVNSAADEIDPYSAVGEGVLFFASNRPGGLGGYDLYFARRSSAVLWDSVEALPAGINSASNETGPCEKPERLFFASDRPGGLGGSDLYAAALSSASNLEYQPPVNLGTPVNSGANELDPELSTDEGDSLSVLYFASDSLSTTFDLYRVVESMGTWAPPTNLGSPVNTPGNETDPSFGLEGSQLYFASDRAGGHGGWDIFSSANLAKRPFVLWDGDATAPPGGLASVQFDVVNRGRVSLQLAPQTFNTAGWPMSYSPVPFALAPGARTQRLVMVQVPTGAALGDSADVIFQVFSIGPGPSLAEGQQVPTADHARITVVDTSLVSVPGVVPSRAFVRASPNPHAGNARIEFGLPIAGPVRIELYDLMGRHVRTLSDGSRPAGIHQVQWDGRDANGGMVSAGVIFCRMFTSRETVRATLIRVR